MSDERFEKWLCSTPHKDDHLVDIDTTLTDEEHSMMINWGSKNATIGDLEAMCSQFMELLWSVIEQSDVNITNDQLLAEFQEAFIPFMQNIKDRYAMDKR